MSVFLKEGSLRKIADLNIKFHSTIEQCSKSKELIIILDNLYKKSRERFSEIISKADRQKKSIEEHKMIVEAIIKKDSLLAEKLMREHIVNGKEALIQEIELRGKLFKKVIIMPEMTMYFEFFLITFTQFNSISITKFKFLGNVRPLSTYL